MSGMAPELKRDPDLEWLDHVQPVGLVVASIVLKDFGLAPSRQTQADTAGVIEQIDADTTKPALREAWPLFAKVLGWEPQHVDGSPGGRDLPDDLYVKLPEHDTTLSRPGRSGSWTQAINIGNSWSASSPQASILMGEVPLTDGRQRRISDSSGCYARPASSPDCSSQKRNRCKTARIDTRRSCG
jgi:hypothetical protein